MGQEQAGCKKQTWTKGTHFIQHEKRVLTCWIINEMEIRSYMVVVTAASQPQGAGFDYSLGQLSVWSLHILPVSAWFSCGALISSHSPKICRLKKTQRKKYGLLASYDDHVEMAPVDTDDDDTTLFEVKGMRR
ncbi:uncharacterized protein LOC125466016 isoform X2 [Stegostoma tigrinum]|uniref:uncharacterized protein LOC125466016 isoform X2 n=1 Tax=Stegostoma tigrinum TaxID=3053191 RepID=UPI00202B0CDA|nr:uncharacterized protein LOC125466016 isoform X2 [Stegostoma tigrinum]